MVLIFYSQRAACIVNYSAAIFIAGSHFSQWIIKYAWIWHG